MSEAHERLAHLSLAKRRLLLKMRREQAEADPQRIPRRAPGAPAPLSFAQQRLWFIDQLQPGSTAYNVPAALRLRGALDARSLRRALAAVVRRHEVLRTVLPVRDGEPVQEIRPAGPLPFPVVELAELAPERREAEAVRLAAAEAARPFDLARGPLLRATLLRLDREDHAALFTLHHVVSDAWSMDVLTREISALYGAYSRGEEPRLPELPVQYADYAAWQRRWLSGAVLEAQLAWWRERLAGAPPVLEVPADRPRRPLAEAPWRAVPVALSAGTSRALRELARREGATPFMASLAAWQLLLGRYAGEDDVVVGSPIAGRTRAETEGLIGFFVNTLVLRADLSGDAGFRGLLGRVRETTLGAFQHQDLPFERLVEELQPERSLTHAPLFQVMFSLEAAGAAGPRLGDVRMEPLYAGEGVSLFDLDLNLEEGPERIRGVLRYRTDLFEAATVERMAGHFRVLLEGVLGDPGRPLAEISLLGGEERTQVVALWNATARPYPRERCLHELVSAQAARTPGAPAVLFEGRATTYAELEAGAGAVAERLRGRGVRPETRVGICVEKGPGAALAVLGVLQAGGAYVPLDPAYPAGRLEYLLADSGASLVLTQPELAGRFAASGVEVVLLDEAPRSRALGPAHPPSPGNLAYVIYTSGSTGTPKGVAVPHRAVVNLATDMAERLGLRPDDRLLSFASLSFDVSVEEIFTAWVAGAAVVFSGAELFAPGALLEVVEREGVTSFELPTAYWHEWVRELSEGGRRVPECVRFVRVGGERISMERLREWAELRVPLVHAFGLTETACTSAALRLEAGDDGSRWGSLPIGRPSGNVRLYVLDRAGQPAPVGVPGELFVGGEGVARGYLGRPELTAERFVPDALGGGAGERLYRTGDRVRWLSDGTMEFLGRIDHQVKVRGFRIEPAEVEAALARHPAVAEALVTVRGAALVAYYTAEGEAPAAGELREHLRGMLPPYMVPGAFVALERLPLSPSGKVDRRALPAPAAEDGRGYAAARTETERALAEAWAEILGRERVGIEDDFFELGGHSLLATRVVSRAREAFGVELPVRALFEAPTVAGLAERVEALLREGAGAQAPPIVPVLRDGDVPLSFAQQRLWFIDRLEPGSSAYNMSTALRLRGALEVRALHASLEALVRRHETLRTVFAVHDGEPVQVIGRPGPVPFPTVDLAAVPARRREAETVRLAAAEAARPFDLARGPLLRATLLRLGREDHAALFTLHHVVSDAWSMDVLVREVSALYGAYSRGEEPRLPELPVQYADYAAWQRRWLSGAVLEAQLGWWKERLAGAPSTLDLPADGLRRPGGGAPAGARPLVLGPGVSRELRGAARREGATPFMALLAAWQLLLSRYSGAEDVVVGSPIAGRTRAETEGLIGFFVNTLVLRTDLSGDPTFGELLGRVRETTLGAFAHQELPFERLVEELAPERSLAHTPLFQVAFAFETAAGGGGALRLEGVEAAPLATGPGAAKFDLSLGLVQEAEEIAGELVYRADLFEDATAGRMAGHLEAVLEALSAGPGRRVSEVSLLRAAEREQVVEAWNRTARPYPRGVCIHELFEARVRERPDAAALAWEEVELTYAQLDARANRLAHHLRARGVGPESRVGVLLERGVDLVVSILAVLKAGGCYVPLDPGYPAERLRMMLDDSGVRVLVGRGDPAFAAEAVGPSVVLLDRAAEALAREPAEAPRSGATAENLAYIVYTSGSTGRPKGVMVAHRHVVQLAVETDYVRLQPGDRVAQASNASFDALAFEAWGALMNGATLVGIPRDVLLSPPAFREMLVEQRITTLYQTTALLNQLSREQPDVFAPVREVLFGGQAVDADSVRRLLAAGGPRRLLHMYGPTETTAWCSWEQVEHVAEDALTVPVGRATGNQRIYLLDPALGPVPVGVPGEAYVGGDGVVRGYLDGPALTAERFVPDPFAAEAGRRMYRTGDRLRWKADGKLEFIGRVDEQVKVRGFRIEPGEIEAVLCGHAEVREARVIVREDEPGEQRLVGYVVGAADAAELRRWLGESLPDYMVPSALVALERLPLTPNGKLDRRALPAPAATAGGRYAAPRTATEQTLAGIWAAVLRVERVGVEDDFFALGGHSLMATRVVSRIREALGVEVPLRALFESPTVARLAERADQLLGAGAGARLPPLRPAPREGPLPLSFAQQRLWFIHQLEPRSPAYNIPSPLRLRGPLRPGVLERALTELVRRHESLRTVFRSVGGEPVQVIRPAAPAVLPVVDLRGLGEERREALVRRLAAEEAGRPFDLARGPLLRAVLLRPGDEEWALLFTVHHVVSDGWSMGVLVKEISRLYDAFARGLPSPLPEPDLQYADYAVWQREWLAGEALERQLAFWRERLAGAPPLLELPVDHPRPPVAGDRAAQRSLVLPVGTSRALQALARREGATLFMTLLAVYQALLARWSGQDDVSVGTPVAGRGLLELEGLIGFFVNMLVIRTGLEGRPSSRELVARVREGVLGAQAHQDLPFERLVDELGVERSLSRAPLFQVLFALVSAGSGEERLSLGEVEVHPLDAGETTAKFDLSLTLQDGGEALAGSVVYRTGLFEAATVERMLGHFRVLADGVAAAPDRPVGEIELVSAAERTQLEAWNATERPYPAGLLVHDLFAAQAARTPEAPAVSWRGERLTYAELDRRSARLANALRRRGVGPETRVGVCLGRTPELLVALLGVLRAGGAYVPLDPAYPRERLGFMVEDAGITLVLTESALADRAAAGAAELFVLEAEREALSTEPEHAPASGVLADNLSHVIFTSGSTGRPKGVMIRHGGTAVLLHWLRDNVTDEERSATLFSTSINFDVSVAEVFGTLCWGGMLVLVENALELAGVEEAVVYATMVPSAAAELLRTGGIPASVRTLNLGGEALPASLARGLYALGTVERLGNLYGPTEDTTYSTCALVRRGADPVPVGRPLANTRAHVLDANLLPVPPGMIGELYLAGDGLSRGYAARPDLTAERFLPDPFGVPGSRMYRVMDRVRWSADGELEYFGRTDFQVKVRGFRIELGEIEAALGRHPAVREAVATVREDAPGDRRLVAYVTAGPGGVSPAELRAFAGGRLPEHMVPSAVVVLDSFPRLPNGKTDRRALPAPEPAGGGAAGNAAPRDALELAVARAWAEVLGVPAVGVRDSFFELGGHSLLGVRLMGRIEELTGRRLPLATLFAAPTVEALASALRGEAAVSGAGPLVPIQPGGTGRPVFFVHAAGGNVVGYAELGRHLGAGQPFYGVQSRGLDGDEAPHECIEAMAADYLAEIRAVHPGGPFRLGGWSMGAVVAFEMARQLQAAGDAVELLALVDPSTPEEGAERPLSEADDPGLLASFALHLGIPPERVSVTPGEILALGPAERLRHAWEAARAEGAVPPDLDFTRFERLWSVFRHNVDALRRYRPGRLAAGAGVLLVRAEQGSDPAETSAARWWALTGGQVTLETSPGDHFGMVREPHVRTLAEVLAAHLEGGGAQPPLATPDAPGPP